jgi:phosphohistidine phosphatase SixA
MFRAAWRTLFLVCVLASSLGETAGESHGTWDAVRAEGRVALVRHARAPGIGDPEGYRIDDCTTQRNLSEEGREQARRLGAMFRAENINVTKILSSQWCRCRQTAELMDLGPVEEAPTFNNAHVLYDRRDELAAGGRRAIAAWKGPGILLVVTHGANVLAMFGVHPREGEVVVVEPDPAGEGKISIVARIPPSSWR